MTFWPIKTTKYIHSLQSSIYCTATVLETTLSSSTRNRRLRHRNHLVLHVKSFKLPQIFCENRAEIASVEKSASGLHILRLQNKCHALKTILQILCTEVGSFDCIFECSQLTRIIDSTVSGHLCHIIVDQWKLYSFLGISRHKND